ncbi:hypothetical protein Thal_0191 [Thermocrinis albus DSM 14484]|uniref:Uncharacterized protein n=1 Tax=Thermocrinis albus (strain DSM 14484 / JCM 11386 / HI 11/12) TaxID=638303 RepID=D3SNU0_THEAH|nr:delta-60 repeat domain-containing protein [Thermocrinis albus]ADC88827.1 hypothetical protein Thal_0191 [Thermocrinis albus DSM 14484]
MKRYVGYFVFGLIAMGIVFSGYGGGGGGGGRVITAPSGSLDTTFGRGGIVTTDIGTNREDEAKALAIQSDGKIVVVGYSYNGTNTDFAVVRYNPDGSLDTSFGTNGIVTTDIGTNSEDKAYALAIQRDGKIVVAGTSDGDFAIVRYWP